MEVTHASWIKLNEVNLCRKVWKRRELPTDWFQSLIFERKEEKWLALLLHIFRSLIHISARRVTILRAFHSFTESTEKNV
jgi:hypothetical protein